MAAAVFQVKKAYFVMTQGAGWYAVGTVKRKDTAKLEGALAVAAGERPNHRTCFALAGPNDIVQFLSDSVGWAVMAYLAKPYFDALFGKAGEASWKAMSSMFSQAFSPKALKDEEARREALKAAISSLKELSGENSISFGFPSPRQEGHDRNICVALNVISMEEFAKLAALLAAIGPRVEEIVRQNPDVHFDFEPGRLTADGEAILSMRLSGKETLRLTIDTEGNISEKLQRRG